MARENLNLTILYIKRRATTLRRQHSQCSVRQICTKVFRQISHQLGVIRKITINHISRLVTTLKSEIVMAIIISIDYKVTEM